MYSGSCILIISMHIPIGLIASMLVPRTLDGKDCNNKVSSYFAKNISWEYCKLWALCVRCSYSTTKLTALDVGRQLCLVWGYGSINRLAMEHH